MLHLINVDTFLNTLSKVVEQRNDLKVTDPPWKTEFMTQVCNVLQLAQVNDEHLRKYGLLPCLKDEQVIFSGPVTTIIQPDGTKTQVKCVEGDRYDAKYGYLLTHFMIAYGMTRTQVGKLLKKIDQDSLDQRTKGFVKMLAKEARQAQRAAQRKQIQEEEDEFEVLVEARSNHLQEVMWQAMQNMVKRTGTCPDCRHFLHTTQTPCVKGYTTPRLNCGAFKGKR